MSNKIIAFESANSFVKIYHDGKHVVYPNTISRAGKERFDKIVSKRDNTTVYTINGENFTAGNTLGYISSSSASIERYASEHYYRESIIAISHFVNDGDTVIVATGIPADHYKNKEKATKLIKDALKGEHTIGINGKEITFTIKDVLVTMQGLATFFYTVIDEWGNVDEEMVERYDGTETLIVDLGWGSSDVAVIRGNSLVDYQTLTTSMKTAYERILEHLQTNAAKEGKKLATARIQLLELERQLRQSDVFKYSNEQYDASNIKRSVFKETTDDIITEINNYRPMEQFTTVIFTGGGTKALLPELEPRLADPKTNKLQENIFIMNETQISNVKGYYVFAKYLQN